MAQSNHTFNQAAGRLAPHAASLLQKIAALEAELDELAKHTLVWDDASKQLKRRKLQLRDELAALQRRRN
ncbi:MAG: YdcH family protein [Alphaproteobacteria bacterium]|nr:YdcH family protein [Alphaproteobacteria bacterium]